MPYIGSRFRALSLAIAAALSVGGHAVAQPAGTGRTTPGTVPPTMVPSPFIGLWELDLTRLPETYGAPAKRVTFRFDDIGSGMWRTTVEITAQDDSAHPLVAIANESFVKRYLPGEDPIGRRVNIYGFEREIVGIAASEKFLGLDRDAPPAIYLPFEQNPLNGMTVIVRTADSACPRLR